MNTKRITMKHVFTLRLTDEHIASARKVAAESGLSLQDVLRLSITKGIPLLEKALAGDELTVFGATPGIGKSLLKPSTGASA